MSKISAFFRQSPKPENQNLKAMPQHIAIIMDGNGRWARARGLPRTAGHKKGADTLRTILNACRDASIRYLTIYAFSSENWKRAPDEIRDLMQLLQHYLRQELPSLHENRIRLRFIGDLSLLEDNVRQSVEQASALTADNDAFHLTVALSYGSRQEIVHAARNLAARVEQGELKPDAIDEALFETMLDTRGMPAPDLLIRTGGEQRLSNFLLWQSAYSEFYFTPVLWPDFDTGHFNQALAAYAGRERRYGTAG